MKKFNKKIFFIILFVWIILYTFSTYIIFERLGTSLFSFGGKEIILYSIFHFVITFIIYYLITNWLISKGVISKIILLVLFLILSSNLWYTYNSFPSTIEIEIINNTGKEINIKVTPIYKFDNEIDVKLAINEKSILNLFGGGEYGILKDKSFQLKGYINKTEIYSKYFKVSDFTKGEELEPKIIIN